MSNAIKIAVDAGHGSYTAGKRTPPMPQDIDFEKDGVIDVEAGKAIMEHWANVGVAFYLSKYLKKWGFEVVPTGWDDKDSTDDIDLALSKRQKIIKDAECLLSVSAHFNAFGNGKEFNTAQGIETLIHINKSSRNNSEALAEKIQERISGGTEQKDRGIKTADLAMCNAVVMGTEASVLCEYAFMTNEAEAYLMGNRNFWKECGKETALGIRDYLWEKPKGAIRKETATRGEIIWIQIKLRLAGEDIVTTGIWDEQTEEAIRSFKGKNIDVGFLNEKQIDIIS